MGHAADVRHDVWSSGAPHNDQFAIRNLTPMGKSLVDLLVLNKDILEYLLHKCIDTRSFLEPAQKTIRDVSANIDTFREQCGYFCNTKNCPAPLLDFIILSLLAARRRSKQIHSAFPLLMRELLQSVMRPGKTTRLVFAT